MMTTRSIASIIREHARNKPSAPAVSYPDRTLTWDELDRRSNRRARHLISLGVKHDDRIVIMLPNGSEFHEAVLGVWKAGATPCLLPGKLPGREAGDLLALAQPAAVIGNLPIIFDGAHILADADLVQFSDADFEADPATHWKAVASGGSSGRPKLVVDSMPAALDTAAPPYAAMGIPSNGAILNPGPLYHNAPFMFSSFALMAGAHVVGMARFEAEECLRLIERHKVRFVVFVPTMMQRILALPDNIRASYDLSSLAFVWHMAAPCPAWVKRAWIDWLGPDRIFEAYGGTEGAPGTFITGKEWLAKPGSVGKAELGGLRILREDGTEAGTGEIGEVSFPAAGKRKFSYVGAEAKTDADGGFSLGDLGHIDAEGYLFLADRRSDLIIRGGANIYPAEVEAVLDEHPLVSTSAVVGLPDVDLGERVHAIVQLREGARFDLAAIADHVATRLAKYKWPASYELSETALRDDAGKVRRTVLKKERRTWLEEGRTFQLSAS